MSPGRDETADVVVVGAGASGIPAAIAAARTGARAVLLEEDPVIGGAPVDMYVSMLCGGPVTGILSEAREILRRKHAIIPGNTAGEWFLPQSYQQAWHELIAPEPNLSVVAGARVVDVETRGGAVTAAVVERAPGVRRAVAGRVFVDATGTGAVAVQAGCAALYGRDAKADFGEPHAVEQRDDVVQACTWMYISQRMGEAKPFDMRTLEASQLVRVVGAARGFKADPEEALRVNPGIYLHWGSRVMCKDTRDPVELGRAQTEALQQMARDHAVLRENGFAIHLAPRLGVRECSRIVGEHVVTENEMRSGTLPDDTIAVGTYPIDIWGDDYPGDEASRVPGYGIPYRALVPKDVDGLLVVGKSISGTHVAMGGYRVQPIVASIGQAAGVAAALCARERWRPRQADPAAIRAALAGERQRLLLSLDDEAAE